MGTPSGVPIFITSLGTFAQAFGMPVRDPIDQGISSPWSIGGSRRTCPTRRPKGLSQKKEKAC